jgi:MoaA/NifB/PqqE/SkfB family radical SAM enzyme
MNSTGGRIGTLEDRIEKPAAYDFQTLRDGDVFCMMPWVALHVAMNGNAYPCCFADGELPIGSVGTQTVTEIWNGARLRELRVGMLEGRRSPVCAKCYEQEASGFSSLRTSANANNPHQWPVVGETCEDGTVARPNIVSLDVRFSNVCNFACRTCGPFASTAWAKYAPTAGGRLLRPRRSSSSLLEELAPLLGCLEHAYFSGGEPLLTEEHYRLLEMLLGRGRADVHLSYSTNYSVFEFRHWNVLELWRSFPRVDVSASLDGSHERGEYLRKGQRWSQVVENRRRQREQCPHVVFSVSSTLCALNALHLPDLHEELIETGFVQPGYVFINILQAPPHLRLTTLPGDVKQKVRMRYERHLEYLAKTPDSAAATQAYEAAIRFMYSQDTAHDLDRLREVVAEQDRARDESFASTFPELGQLMTV